MKKNYLIVRLIIALCIFQNVSVLAQTPPEFFDTQYSDAISLIQERHNEITMICGNESNLCIAIAFPEMLRFSLWRNLFETKALELAYVNKGKEYADFSIGWFQIKPSFVEQLEKDLQKTAIKHKYTDVICTYSSNDINLQRAERINRLKSFSWQLKYLHAFMHWQTARLNALGVNESEHLRLIAAAYNHGSHHSVRGLRRFNQLKAFPYGMGKDNPFAFADLVEYFYYHNNNLLK